MNKKISNKDLLEKAEEYFRQEYKDFLKYYDKPLITHFSNEDRMKYALQRGLGVSFFLQYFGIPFDEIGAIYNDYKEKIEKKVRGEIDV